MFLDITIEKDFIMVTVLNEEDFKNVPMNTWKFLLSGGVIYPKFPILSTLKQSYVPQK